MHKSYIIKRIKSLSNPKNVQGMARFGINLKNTYGVPIPELRKMAKEIGTNHALALELWTTGIHEARILASMIADKDKITSKQMDSWVKDFDSWDVCDQCCMNLFRWTKHAHKKVLQWSKDKKEFVRRAGFALLAAMAFDHKQGDFEQYFPLIKKYSIDERNFVKKAVNWALRQIGKRDKIM